jgi:hypothetical protein
LLVLYTPLAALFDVYGIGVPGWTRIAGGVLVVLVANYGFARVADRLL